MWPWWFEFIGKKVDNFTVWMLDNSTVWMFDNFPIGVIWQFSCPPFYYTCTDFGQTHHSAQVQKISFQNISFRSKTSQKCFVAKPPPILAFNVLYALIRRLTFLIHLDDVWRTWCTAVVLYLGTACSSDRWPRSASWTGWSPELYFLHNMGQISPKSTTWVKDHLITIYL